MKILFCTFGSTNRPHFEFELDILLSHLEKGDEVYMVQCLGELNYCYKNRKGNPSKCKYCIEKFNYAFKVLNLSEKIKVYLPKGEVKKEVYDKEFKDIEALKKYSYGGFSQLGAGAGSIVVDITSDHAPDTIKHSSMIKNFLKSMFYAYKSLDILAKEIKPDLAYIFNGRSLNYRSALEVMQNNKIPFFTHERGSSHSKFMLFPNSICQSKKLMKDTVLKMWDNGGIEKEKMGSAWFEQRRTGQHTNWKSFTKNQTKGQLPENFDTTKKNITIFNSSISEYVCIPDRGKTIYSSDIEGIEQIARDISKKSNYFLYLRVHPHLKNKMHNTQMQEIIKLSKKNIPNFQVIMPYQLVDTYLLMSLSDKVITFGSTMGVEATYWERPSIQAGDAYHKGELDVTYNPKTHQELMDLVFNDKLLPKPKINSIKCGYKESNFGISTKYYQMTSPWTGTLKGKILIPSQYIIKRLDYFWRNIKYKITGW